MIKFLSGPNVHFAQKRAFHHDGKGAINRCPRDGVINGSRVIKQLLGRKVLGLHERCIKNGQPLIGHAQSFLGQKAPELIACRGDVHPLTVRSVAQPVNAIVGSPWLGPFRGGARVGIPA